MIELEKEDYILIRDFLGNDLSAFDKLVFKYQHTVYNLCLRMLGQPDDAADCAQETFIKVYKSLKCFEFKSTFTTWLYRITVNTCKNKLASAEYRRHKNFVLIDQPVNSEDESYYREIPDNSSSPAAVFEQKMTETKIMEAIQSLPSGQKILVILCDIEGRSYEEIAQITRLHLGTIKSRLARARHTLRRKLEGVITG